MHAIEIAEAQFFHVAEDMGLYSNTLHLNGDPVDPVVIENFVYEVKERFATRDARRAAHPVAPTTTGDVAKGILKELIRGLPKRS